MTVLQTIIKKLHLARVEGMPICLLDTDEFETARDVAFHPDQPVSPALKKDDFWQLLSGEDCLSAENVLCELPESFHDTPHTYVVPLLEKNEAQQLALQKFAVQYRLGNLTHSMILLYGRSEGLPKHLKNEVSVIPVPYPDQQEIRMLIAQALESQHLTLPEDAAHRLAMSLRGFTVPQLRALLRLMLLPEGDTYPIYNAEKCNETILEKKKQVLLRSGGLLKLINVREPHVGGMQRLIDLATELRPRIIHADSYIQKRGAGVPKGLLVHGTPGTGKSEAAQLLAWCWRIGNVPMPLLRMDMGRLMGGLLGDSERHLRQALELVEAMSPAILWIDEIEKGLSGMGGGDPSQGSGTAGRMFSTLLTWMQKHDGTVFIYATCNSLSDLKEELLRKGRFDELYSFFMPTHEECKAIFEACMYNQKTEAENARRNAGIDDTTPVFGPGCTDDLDLIIGGTKGEEALGVCLANPGNGRSPLFVTGADIAYIVREASVLCEHSGPIMREEWIGALQKVISQPTLSTTGSGENSMSELALGCIRAMGGKFIPVSAPDQVFFKPEDYHLVFASPEENNGKVPQIKEVRIDSTCPTKNQYDKLLFNTVLKYIKALALPYEQQHLMQQTGKR